MRPFPLISHYARDPAPSGPGVYGYKKLDNIFTVGHFEGGDCAWVRQADWQNR